MRIVIVGAGIGGLTAALALARAGRSITLLERRTGFAEAGAGIQLSPNATGPLARLGLLPALRRAGVTPEAIVVRALASGAEIGRMRLGRAMEARFGAPYLQVARSDLHTILLDAVRARGGAALRMGREVTTIDEAGGEVRLATVSATGTADAIACDLAVVADGVGSTLRAVVGIRRRPVGRSLAALRAVGPISALPAALRPDEGGLWLGRGRHLVHYPIEGGRRVNLVAVAPVRRPLDGWSSPVPEDDVIAAIGRLPPALRHLAEAIGPWSAWQLSDLPASTMGRGRIALVGDAAHPVLPYLAQGGALAIEDAVTLAALLGDGTADIPGAVRDYGVARLARVRRVQTTARRNGFAYHAGPIAAPLRDLVLRRAGPDGLLERYAWIYGWRPPMT